MFDILLCYFIIKYTFFYSLSNDILFMYHKLILLYYNFINCIFDYSNYNFDLLTADNY